MHGTLRFLFSFISPIVWNMCENYHESDGYILKSYSTSKNTIYRAGAAVVSNITSVPFKQRIGFLNRNNLVQFKKS